jgi:hypothetical protein
MEESCKGQAGLLYNWGAVPEQQQQQFEIRDLRSESSSVEGRDMEWV